MFYFKFIFLFALIKLIVISTYSQTTGPESGTLLIIGGNASDSLFIPIFKKMAGGDSTEIVIIPTARDNESIAADPNFNNLLNRFKKYQLEENIFIRLNASLIIKK